MSSNFLRLAANRPSDFSTSAWRKRLRDRFDDPEHRQWGRSSPATNAKPIVRAARWLPTSLMAQPAKTPLKAHPFVRSTIIAKLVPGVSFSAVAAHTKSAIVSYPSQVLSRLFLGQTVDSGDKQDAPAAPDPACYMLQLVSGSSAERAGREIGRHRKRRGSSQGEASPKLSIAVDG